MTRAALPQKTTPIERHAGESAYHTPMNIGSWYLPTKHPLLDSNTGFRGLPCTGSELNESKDVYHDYIKRCS